jgi:hypothetical protein
MELLLEVVRPVTSFMGEFGRGDGMMLTAFAAVGLAYMVRRVMRP